MSDEHWEVLWKCGQFERAAGSLGVLQSCAAPGRLLVCLPARGMYRDWIVPGCDRPSITPPAPHLPTQADVQSPGLLQVLTEGKTANTAVVQLHLGRLALAGGAPGGGSGASGGGGGGGGGTVPPKPRPAASGAQQAQPPPVNQYITNSVPSRHLLLLGVADRDDVARLAGIARQHGTLQKYLHNPRNSSLTLHFDSTEQALNMAREVEGQCLPGLAREWGWALDRVLSVVRAHLVAEGCWVCRSLMDRAAVGWERWTAAAASCGGRFVGRLQGCHSRLHPHAAMQLSDLVRSCNEMSAGN